MAVRDWGWERRNGTKNGVQVGRECELMASGPCTGG